VLEKVTELVLALVKLAEADSAPSGDAPTREEFEATTEYLQEQIDQKITKA